MRFSKRLAGALASEDLRRKFVEMVTEFLQEAAVLAAVLGILEASIAYGVPNLRVLAWSLGGGCILFLGACLLQALQAAQSVNRAEGENNG